MTTLRRAVGTVRLLDRADWLVLGAIVFGGIGFLLAWPPAAFLYVAAVCIALFLLNVIAEARR